jgi:hypothetical protein
VFVLKHYIMWVLELQRRAVVLPNILADMIWSEGINICSDVESIHTYIHTYTYTHAYTHTYIHRYMHAYMHNYIYNIDALGPRYIANIHTHIHTDANNSTASCTTAIELHHA